MDKDKHATITTGDCVGELVHIVNNNLTPIVTSPSLSSTRTHFSPLMGTSARAAKRRLDGDTGPLHIDDTDTYDQQLQYHYQNVRQILEDQQPSQISNIDRSNESRQSFSAKRDFFEQRSKSSPSTYDSPPREQQPAQKIITTITTTTTTTPTIRNQSNSSLKESTPSVDRLLEQAAELQKLTNVNSTKNDPQQPLVIERTEQYQVFLDPTNQELRRTPTIPITKTSYATDLDQAQARAQADRLVDDHQAIQQLTRVLQEHNTTTINEYKRLPSQTNPILINTTTTTTTTIPSNFVLVDRTNQPITSEFTVIDALLNNPLGTNNNKQNHMLHTRFNDILSNLRNSEYVNVLKQSTKKITKKKKSKKSTDEQTSLLHSKDKKKQAKEKKKRNKIKSKKLSDNTNYQVIDAIINSPISLRLPDSYLAKYKANPSLYQLSSTSSITRKDNTIPFPQQLDTKAKNETAYDLVKVVNELMLHHAAVSQALVTTTKNEFQKSVTPTNLNQIHQQRSITNSNQYGTQPRTSESIKPRIIYRYMDEQGRILKISSTSPSQLREIIPKEPLQNSYQNIEPTYFRNRQIVVDDKRHPLISEREQRTTRQDESKSPTTITKEELQLRDKRIPKLSEQLSSTTRTIPISIEREHSIKTPSQQQQHISPHPNQQNVQLTWLPLSYQLDQKYVPSGTAGYDSDSTNSEHSIKYGPYDYAPINTHSRYNNRPLFEKTHYQNHSPVRSYYPSPSRLPYGSRGISPDYADHGVSRNYIEVFRDGEIRPSEVYSLPFNESTVTNHHHSRYDQYQPLKHVQNRVPSSSPHSKYAKIIIPSLSNPDPHSPPTDQNSPNHDYIYFDNYLRPSKSFDYRPLRTKLQREYKITPNLLVDEWDHSQQLPSTDYNKQTSVSSPDDVFYKFRRHITRPNKKPINGTNGNTEQQMRINGRELIDANQQKPEYKTQTQLTSQPIYKALALHSFYAQTSRELSFKKGDILLVLRRINDDWLEGEHEGLVGIFPLNHVELFPIKTTEQEVVFNDYEKEHEIEGEAIVKYDFIPQKTFELQLRKGDKVILLRRLDDNWYEGRLNHIEGIFPAAYVETLREPPSDILSKKSHQNEQIQLAKQSSPVLERTSTEKMDIVSGLSLPLRKCQVLYDYTPQNPDELEIHVGDIINIIEMCDDGWYCGIMDKSNYTNAMAFGTFPGNYVKLLPT